MYKNFKYYHANIFLYEIMYIMSIDHEIAYIDYLNDKSINGDEEMFYVELDNDIVLCMALRHETYKYWYCKVLLTSSFVRDRTNDEDWHTMFQEPHGGWKSVENSDTLGRITLISNGITNDDFIPEHKYSGGTKYRNLEFIKQTITQSLRDFVSKYPRI